MASYIVMEPPPDGRGQRERQAVLVRDGFHFFAFLIPVLWLVFHRLWIEALFVFAVTLVLSGLGSFAGLGNAAPILSLLVSIYVGLEGSALKLAALRRRGWRDAGVVEADDTGDAEIRYLYEATREEARLVELQPAAPVTPQAQPQAAPRQPSGPALGLFSYPGRN